MTAADILVPNALYIALWVRDDPPPPNRFHWALYHHHSSSRGGTRYEIRNIGPVDSRGSGWIADHTWCSDILETSFLCVLIRVSTLPIEFPDSNGVGKLDQLAKMFDRSLNEIPGVSCRVWLLLVMEKLEQEGLVKAVAGDVRDLEKECMDLGNEARFDASANKQPRPVVVSKVCE